MNGIGITTRNRPELLQYALMHFTEFKPKNNSKFIIVDDNSSIENKEKNSEIAQLYNIPIIYNETQFGIAKSKNTCIANLTDVDYYFLFDDDCFPIFGGWDEHYILASIRARIGHFNYIVQHSYIKRIAKNDIYEVYADCNGTLMFANKKCIEAIGGLDESYGIYGFEHAEFSQRAFKTGFCGKQKGYLSPKNAARYIFALDFDLKLGRKSPLGQAPIFTSTITESVKNQYVKELLPKFNAIRIF